MLFASDMIIYLEAQRELTEKLLETIRRDPSVAQRFSACLQSKAMILVPGLSPTLGSLHEACFSLCLCLCLFLPMSLMNK